MQSQCLEGELLRNRYKERTMRLLVQQVDMDSFASF